MSYAQTVKTLILMRQHEHVPKINGTPHYI